MEITIDDSIRIFLSSSRRAKRDFSEAFSSQPEIVQRHLLSKGYVMKNGNLESPHELTALGRTYAEYHSNKEISA